MLNLISKSRFMLVFALPFFLGCVSVFSFQPFNFSIINFFVFPILFLILSFINKLSKNTYRKKPYLRNLFFVGYFFGIGFFLTGSYWISHSLQFDETFKSLIPFAITLLPIFLGLFFGFCTLICGPFLKLDLKSIFLFSSTFSLFDYIRSKIFTGFPWNLWSYSWSWFEEVLQILNPIGLFAFNFLVIIFFSIPSILFFKNYNQKYFVAIISLSLFFFNYIYGNMIINKNLLQIKNLNSKTDFINIKIVSPNFDLKYNLDNRELIDRIKKLIKYSEPDKEKETLFIWPEGALSGQYFNDLKKFNKNIKENFSDKHFIALGVNTRDGKKFFNSFLIVDNNFEKKYQYDKVKLVPFGEFLPFNKTLEKFGFKKVTEGFGSFSVGKLSRGYSYKGQNIIPLICYEIIFTELLQKDHSKNIVAVNISEDAWFGDSIGPHQHFAKSIFRAIESNSFILRSANKGISAVINNKGQVVKSLKSNESGNLEYALPVLKKKYKNKNDLIFFILLITNILIFIILKKNEK